MDAVANGNMNAVTSNAAWNMNNLKYNSIQAGDSGDILSLIAANATPNKTSLLRISGQTTCTNWPNYEQYNDFFYLCQSADNNNYLTVMAWSPYNDDKIYCVNRMNGVWKPWKLFSAIESKTFSGTTDSGGTIILGVPSDAYCVIGLDFNLGSMYYSVTYFPGVNTHEWILRLGDLVSGAAVSGVSVSGTVYYTRH